MWRRAASASSSAVGGHDEEGTPAPGVVLKAPAFNPAGPRTPPTAAPLVEYLLRLGDDRLVLGQLRTALANHGLKEINPLGQPFDPHQHEAIAHQPSEMPAEQVAAVVRTGYSLNGRLLRPASVMVSSGPAK